MGMAGSKGISILGASSFPKLPELSRSRNELGAWLAALGLILLLVFLWLHDLFGRLVTRGLCQLVGRVSESTWGCLGSCPSREYNSPSSEINPSKPPAANLTLQMLV